MFKKETWDGVKAFWDSMKFPLLILILLILYLYPGKIREFVDRAGFRVVDMDVFGMHLAEKAAADLEGAGQKLAQVTAALAERDQLLSDIVAQGAVDATMLEKARQALDHGAAIKMSALAVSDRAAIQAAEIGATLHAPPSAVVPPVVAAPPAGEAGPGGFLVVFGADLDIAAATDEIDRVKAAVPTGSGSFALFRKGSFYRSAAMFDTRAARDDFAEAIAKAAGRGVESVALDRWCPAAAPAAGADASAPVFQC